MVDVKDGQEYINRQNPATRFNVSAKFSRRLKSHDRPVRTNEDLLPPDKPQSQFTTIRRP